MLAHSLILQTEDSRDCSKDARAWMRLAPFVSATLLEFALPTFAQCPLGLAPAVHYSAPDGGLRAIAECDLDSDGRSELIVANYGANTVSIRRSNIDGSLQEPVDYAVGNGPHSVAVSDLNVDGKLDLVVANQFSGDVSVLLGNGDGSFQQGGTFPAAVWAVSVAVADFDSDGRPDLAVAD